MTLLLIGLLAGLALASAYLLIAMSFTLVVGVSGVFNFLQATYVMLAMVLTSIGVDHFGFSPFVVLPVLLVLGAAAGVLTNLLLVKPIANRADHLIETALLTTLGASTAVVAIVSIGFGSEAQAVKPYVAPEPWMIGPLPLNRMNVLIIGVTFIIAILFDLILRRSTIGRITRLTLEDKEGAQLSGINTARTTTYSFAAAGALAALAGWLIVPVTAASPSSAAHLAFFAFAAMAVGGFGSFSGAAIGAVVVGVVQGVAPLYVNTNWTTVIILVGVTVLLIIRPSGLRGTAGLFGASGVREI
jgi:branched-subunit amino acid ABC-type transport system permease component